ncbi:lysoplasmalogenase TMEM86B isoform 3-T3 [Glossophaga mutica]
MDTRKEGLPRNARFSAQQPCLASLTPFFLACAAYFLLWVPGDPPSWVGALVKCLPVLSLAGFLRTSSGRARSAALQVALLFSALGDICLIWPQAFLYGPQAQDQLTAPLLQGPGPPSQTRTGSARGGRGRPPSIHLQGRPSTWTPDRGQSSESTAGFRTPSLGSGSRFQAARPDPRWALPRPLPAPVTAGGLPCPQAPFPLALVTRLLS